MNLDKIRHSMIENQLKPNKINDSKVLQFFQEINKENYLKEEQKNIAYTDIDIHLTQDRGYLKNLHIAQLIQSSNINESDKILHIGGLTGYVSTFLSKLSFNVLIIENDDYCYKQLKNNKNKFDLNNVEIINSNFEFGYNEKSPYDLIFIDCPIVKVSKNLLEQLNIDLGRLIYIKKYSDDLGKCIRITRHNDDYNREILFDVFSKFILYQNKNEFIF